MELKHVQCIRNFPVGIDDGNIGRIPPNRIAKYQQHAAGSTIHVFGISKIQDIVCSLLLAYLIGGAKILMHTEIKAAIDLDSNHLAVGGNGTHHAHYSLQVFLFQKQLLSAYILEVTAIFLGFFTDIANIQAWIT